MWYFIVLSPLPQISFGRMWVSTSASTSSSSIENDRWIIMVMMFGVLTSVRMVQWRGGEVW